MELYITNSSTERNGNVYTVGPTAEEAEATLMVSSGAGIAGIAGDGC